MRYYIYRMPRGLRTFAQMSAQGGVPSQQELERFFLDPIHIMSLQGIFSELNTAEKGKRVNFGYRQNGNTEVTWTHFGIATRYLTTSTQEKYDQFFSNPTSMANPRDRQGDNDQSALYYLKVDNSGFITELATTLGHLVLAQEELVRVIVTRQTPIKLAKLPKDTPGRAAMTELLKQRQAFMMLAPDRPADKVDNDVNRDNSSVSTLGS